MKLIKLYFLFLLIWAIPVRAQLNYGIEDGWIVGNNVEKYNNRPLYLCNTNAFILTGDNPIFRFAKDQTLYGTFYIDYVSGNTRIPLHDFKSVKSLYRGGCMKWILQDSRMPKLKIEIEIVPFVDKLGGVLKVSSSGASKGAKLEWFCSAGQSYSVESLSWNFDVMGHPDLLSWGIEANELKEGIKADLPINKVAYLSMVMNNQKQMEITTGSSRLYSTSLEQNQKSQHRLLIDTPDEYLNAMAVNSIFAVDGTWYPPVFVHGCMQWNRALPGWSTIFGGTMYGWHDRVQQQAAYYIDSQVKESDKWVAKADSALLLTGQHVDSRFYGVGRILKDQSFYDMQSQFFDQLVEEYRWTNDSAFVRLLRPALELHLKWMEDCFDPDVDGLYESYMNSWPTDSQWYNGGGTAEATSYAYRAHKAALDMALNAKDTVAAEHHQQMLGRIKKGFFNNLWLKDRGHSGAYREQSGYQRIHADPWLYSIFLPIDAGLTSPLQSVESVYYSEWALQNDKMPSGGKRVWTSNWVPGAWSVREMWPGDNYHLALSYFQAGLPNEGWEIMKGTFMHSAYNHTVPGNLGSDQGGIDFGDCVHTFARSLVSGLFGYNPNYPKNEVVISPSFPTEWNHASIALPDFQLKFEEKSKVLSYEVQLAKVAQMKLLLPVRARSIRTVKADGRKIDFQVLPMPGMSCVSIALDSRQHAKVQIEYEDKLPYAASELVSGEKLSSGELDVKKGEVLSVYDPQEIFEELSFSGNKIKYQLGQKVGFHTVVANVRVGDCTQWRIFRVQITDKRAQEQEAYANMEGESLDGKWNPLKISSQFNSDVRQIYKQKYLSPRPNTVSVRIGTDGFSPWTFPYWGTKAPAIELDKVSSMLKGDILTTPQGVDFYWNGYDKNVSFVSLWDNFPGSMTFDVDRKGEAIAFLVCGSTNMMQCNIENALITITYENGQTDKLPLIPPVNYWNLCPIDSHATAPGQFSRSYYTAETDRFCLPSVFPRTVELGQNCTAMLLVRRLKSGLKVRKVTLKCLSQEVVVGLMGISIR